MSPRRAFDDDSLDDDGSLDDEAARIERRRRARADNSIGYIGGEVTRIGHGGEVDEEREFDDFFRANWKQLRGRLIRRGAPPELADEIASFALMVVHRRWRRLRAENPGGFLTTVANHEFVSQIGPYMARQAELEKSAIDALAKTHADSENDVEISPELEKLLNDLPPRQRQAVVLRHLRGLDVKETARIMGVAEGTVKSHTHDGLRALSSAIDQLHADRPTDEDGKDER